MIHRYNRRNRWFDHCNWRYLLMDDFNEIKNWKVYIPEKKMYIMKDHSWAFAAWEYERIAGNITSDSVLLHIDAHLDDVADGLQVEGLMEAKSKDELFSLIRTEEELSHGELEVMKIQYDNFIWPSFARGTLGSMFSVARQNQQDFATWMIEETQDDYDRNDIETDKEKILKYIPMEKFKSVYRSYSFQEFKERHIKKFHELSSNKNKILDIDLDFFNLSDTFYEPELMPDEVIKEILLELLNLCDWDLITVALSPIYCGGQEPTEHLLNLFVEVADLPTEEVE